MRSTFLFLLGVALASGCGGGGPDVVYHPNTVLDLQTVVDVDGYPDIADPHVIRVHGQWYLYATQSKKDLMVWVSDDLEHWDVHGPVWVPTPGTWNDRGQVWAPHVDAAPDGSYYLYYTADMQIGVARSDSPLGPFTEVYDHPLVGGGYGGVGDGVFRSDAEDVNDTTTRFLLDFEELAIDAFLLRASDGSLIMYFAAYSPLSEIKALPMNDPVTPKEEEPVTVLSPVMTDWDAWVVEGPFVIEHGRRYHLMYSGNWADTVDYAIGAAVGATPFGPFTRYGENPILSSDMDAGLYGPGHHCVVDGAFGDLLMFYHTKANPEKAFDRRIRYTPVEFANGGHIRRSISPINP